MKNISENLRIKGILYNFVFKPRLKIQLADLLFLFVQIEAALFKEPIRPYLQITKLISNPPFLSQIFPFNVAKPLNLVYPKDSPSLPNLPSSTPFQNYIKGKIFFLSKTTKVLRFCNREISLSLLFSLYLTLFYSLLAPAFSKVLQNLNVQNV